MKRLQSKGIGSLTKQAEVLTETDEELLWEKGLLGDSTPQTQLRSDPCQIQLIEQPGQRAYLKYVEDVSKNRPGGIKGRKIKPKIVCHHANNSNPARCFVKKYQKLVPHDRPSHAFYLQPLTKPTQSIWYSKKPLGYHTLNNTVAQLCKEAGIPGNHSLRATAATI